MLKVSYPPNWGVLIPGQQHSLLAGMILAHEFEPLVRFNAKGTVEPGVAKSWFVSDDYRQYTFDIDTSKNFSDGTPLNAKMIKESWERALQMEAISTNHSLADVMYLIEGFEQFSETKILSGVSAPRNDLLIVKFKAPFRLALDHFAGVRYAVTRISNEGHLIGTGPFRIVSKSVDRAILERNPHHPAANENPLEIKIVGQKTDDSLNDLIESKTDLVYLSPFSNIPKLDQNSDKLSIFEGQESNHLVLTINGISGRTFSDPHLRMAFQYLITSEINIDPNFSKQMAPGFRLENQSYLPVQAGRLDESEVQEIIKFGEKYIYQLKSAFSNSNPLLLDVGVTGAWIKAILDKYDIPYKELVAQDSDRWRMFYKTFDADVALFGFSISHGDPDALYHALGAKGAIATGMSQRPRVNQLLESGRGITKIEDLHSHYQQVSKAILEEVPYVHIGFLRRVYAFRKNSLKLKNHILHRRDYDLSSFVPIEQ